MIASKKSAVRKKSGSKPYLTKRILASAAKSGVTEAAERTMSVMGCTVVAHKGWVVKKFADGRIVKISRIKPVNRKRKIALD